jgi:hypothetical protein
MMHCNLFSGHSADTLEPPKRSNDAVAINAVTKHKKDENTIYSFRMRTNISKCTSVIGSVLLISCVTQSDVRKTGVADFAKSHNVIIAENSSAIDENIFTESYMSTFNFDRCGDSLFGEFSRRIFHQLLSKCTNYASHKIPLTEYLSAIDKQSSNSLQTNKKEYLLNKTSPLCTALSKDPNVISAKKQIDQSSTDSGLLSRIFHVKCELTGE